MNKKGAKMSISTRTRHWVFAFAFIAATGLLAGPIGATSAAAACGGNKQKVCEPTKAKYLKDKFNPRPSGAKKFDGRYWKCPSGYKKNTSRKWSHDKTCKDGKKRKPAKNLGRVTNSKPKGSFYNEKTKAYWSCPSDYVRNTGTKIKAGNACRPKIGEGCDKGTVRYRGYCYKKNDCGARNERPCKLVEKSPSGVRRCQKGLSYDFIAGKCIASKMALCLMVARTINAVHNGGKTVEKLFKTYNDVNMKFDKYTGNIRNEIAENLPGISNIRKEAEKKQKWAESKIGSGKDQEEFFNKITAEISKLDRSGSTKKFMKTFASYAKTLKNNHKKIIKEFGKDKICLGGKSYREKVIERLGFTPPDGKADLGDTLMDYAGNLSDFIISPAEAASSGRFFIQLGVGASLNYYGGVSGEIAFITDFKKYNRLHMIVGPSGTTGIGAEGGVALGVFPKVKPTDFPGWSSGIGVSAGIKKKWPISAGLALLMSGDFQLQGVGATFGAGVGSGGRVAGSANYTHDWQIAE